MEDKARIEALESCIKSCKKCLDHSTKLRRRLCYLLGEKFSQRYTRDNMHTIMLMAFFDPLMAG